MTDEREVGIGLLGAGRMESVHAAAYRSVREHYPELAARPRPVLVAEPVESRLRETAQRYGFERWSTDPAEVIADQSVEAVSLTTPNNMHVQLATALARFEPDPSNPMSYNDLKVIESKLFLKSIVKGRRGSVSSRSGRARRRARGDATLRRKRIVGTSAAPDVGQRTADCR